MERFWYRVPMFTDKKTFTEFQYVSLGEQIECTLCGYNGKPQQCIGDKDKNGKYMYEGDIVRIIDNNLAEAIMFPDTEETPELFYIKWVAGGFVLANHDKISDDTVGTFISDVYEVVGNNYENPLLAEQVGYTDGNLEDSTTDYRGGIE